MSFSDTLISLEGSHLVAMPRKEQPYEPVTVRVGLRDASGREAWSHVPDLVTQRLTDWCTKMFRGDFYPFYRTIPHPDDYFFEVTDIGISLATSLKVDLPGHCYFDYHSDPFSDTYSEVRSVKPNPTWAIQEAILDSPDLALDIVDFMLQNGLSNDDEIADMSYLLSLSNSAWSVNGDSNSLTLRESKAEASNFQRIVGFASDSSNPGLVTAGQHLEDAHDYAWVRRNMNAQAAFQSAVMAIESALRDAVMPGQQHARLFHIARELRRTESQWSARVGGRLAVTQLAGVLDRLANEQRKHGQVGYEVNDVAEAQDAVTIATAVVGLVERGFLIHDEGAESEPSG